MRILFWIVRALALLLLVRMLLRALFGSRRPATRAPGGPAGGSRAPERIGGELVRDPQCGTYIPKARAIVVGSGDAVSYFCSTECRDAYAKVRSHV